VQERQLVLHQVRPLPDLGELEAEGGVVVTIPSRPDPDLDPPAAHLVHRRDDLHEAARMPERDRAHERPERDPPGLASQAREHGPGVRRRAVRGPRKARVVVAPEERLEAGRLRPPNDGQLIQVREALLGLDHEREAHRRLRSHVPPPLVDEILASR
jgi:hypothetical protein